MKYTYLLETTKWDTPNHIYIFDGKKSTKIVGYIKDGSNEITMFKKPLPFDKRKRTFKEITVSSR